MPVSARQADSSYNPAYFEPLFKAEDRHFWFRSRNRLISLLVKGLIPRLPSDYIALEIGCGTGNVLQALEAACGQEHVLGMDLFREGLTFARQRVQSPLVQADVHHPPFRRQFDLIGLFDVLEHIPDDRAILDALSQMTAAQGYLLLTVPAYPTLWSYFDEASHHVRRYLLPEINERVAAAGYHVLYSSYWMSTIYPFVYLGRKRVQLAPGQANDSTPFDVEERALQELRIVPGVNEVFTGLLGLEARWVARGGRLPFGTSLVLIAQKLSSGD